MWSQICVHASDQFVVPKGPSDGSQAIYCLDWSLDVFERLSGRGAEGSLRDWAAEVGKMGQFVRASCHFQS